MPKKRLSTISADLSETRDHTYDEKKTDDLGKKTDDVEKRLVMLEKRLMILKRIVIIRLPIHGKE
ncbi:hypothetical protein MTBBW1_230007 [Desulfamplus magnetovallimortis]|uniref:Uncharacterized protein n=1 Tax=Desulfamplus magnetovallimortis TaxID=1246637 RepID=A0A1W1HDL5_9BACT|nr:hypothetical protein [Desulfamplus magnetovallimortis]SLM30523.1 hypothetical protein MTBBW1_230007 [Desulfamplus magnetovallimortis]